MSARCTAGSDVKSVVTRQMRFARTQESADLGEVGDYLQLELL
jgi:hypothetical protein